MICIQAAVNRARAKLLQLTVTQLDAVSCTTHTAHTSHTCTHTHVRSCAHIHVTTYTQPFILYTCIMYMCNTHKYHCPTCPQCHGVCDHVTGRSTTDPHRQEGHAGAGTAPEGLQHRQGHASTGPVRHTKLLLPCEE